MKTLPLAELQKRSVHSKSFYVEAHDIDCTLVFRHTRGL